MAFRFETANERWKAYKQSIMENPQGGPSMEEPLGGTTEVSSVGNDTPGLPTDRQQFIFSGPQQVQNPREMYDNQGNKYIEGTDFVVWNGEAYVATEDAQGRFSWFPAETAATPDNAGIYPVNL